MFQLLEIENIGIKKKKRLDISLNYNLKSQRINQLLAKAFKTYLRKNLLEFE